MTRATNDICFGPAAITRLHIATVGGMYYLHWGDVLFVLGIMIIGYRLEAFDLYIMVAVAGTTSS